MSLTDDINIKKNGGINVINIIGAPIFYGADIKGAEKGPEALRELGLINSLPGHLVRDMGDITVPHREEKEKFLWDGKMKYYGPILDMSRELAEKAYESTKSGGFTLIIGGDHSSAIGSVSGITKHHENIAVIWIDAHGDINTQNSSPTGRIHGMPAAFLLGEGHTELSEVLHKGPKIKPENLFMIGQRSLDDGETEYIEKKGIRLYSVEDYRKRGLSEVLEEIRGEILNNNVKYVHISFDVDFIDKELVPGTGTPVEGGATVEEAELILETIAKWGVARSMDFVELNPEKDIDGRSSRLSIELLKHFFTYLV